MCRRMPYAGEENCEEIPGGFLLREGAKSPAGNPRFSASVISMCGRHASVRVFAEYRLVKRHSFAGSEPPAARMADYRDIWPRAAGARAHLGGNREYPRSPGRPRS